MDQRTEYISRINRVIDHIDRNLSQELKLDELARLANFSKFHFHRIFSAFMGEPLNQFVLRLRLEKAALRLIESPDKSITEIALDFGFSSSAAFARAFKTRFGVSASDWRDSKNNQTNSKLEQSLRKRGKAQAPIRPYNGSEWKMDLDPSTRTLTWRMKTMTAFKDVSVEVQEFPKMHVAYVRHVGPYAGDSALFQRLFTKLGQWAGPRGLFNDPDTKVLTIYHDDPKITDESKLRTSACITIPEDMAMDGEIGKLSIDAGTYAVGHFEINDQQYGEAWNHMMAGWLPQSGYQPDDRICFEMNLNDPNKHPENKHIVDICVPVKPL